MVGGIEIKATQPSWGLGLAELGNIASEGSMLQLFIIIRFVRGYLCVCLRLCVCNKFLGEVA